MVRVVASIDDGQHLFVGRKRAAEQHIADFLLYARGRQFPAVVQGGAVRVNDRPLWGAVTPRSVRQQAHCHQDYADGTAEKQIIIFHVFCPNPYAAEQGFETPCLRINVRRRVASTDVWENGIKGSARGVSSGIATSAVRPVAWTLQLVSAL